jgi:hypothetical protein
MEYMVDTGPTLSQVHLPDTVCAHGHAHLEGFYWGFQNPKIGKTGPQQLSQ